MKLNQVTLPATNIDESKRFYTRLAKSLRGRADPRITSVDGHGE